MGKRLTHAELMNNLTYYMYYQRLRDYALNMFEWKGLPDEVNVRYLELTMLDNGSAVFYKDPTLGYMAIGWTAQGGVNFYNDPINYQPFGIGYNGPLLDKDTGVIIWNNYSRTPIQPILENFAYRLYQGERAMDSNVSQQKFPVVFLTDETQRLTMANLMAQYEGGEPFVMGNKKGFDPESVKAILSGVPYVADKLMGYRNEVWNQAMTFLGVGNAKQDKKERLVADEVQANDEQIMSSRYIMLRARQDACEKINKMFGLNVSVDFKLNIDKQKEQEAQLKAQKQEGTENED